MTKQERISNGIKTVSSANGAGKTGQRQAEKYEPGPLSYTIHKNKLKMDEGPKHKTGTIKILEEKAGKNLFHLGHSNFLLNTSPEARETKDELLGPHQDKKLLHSKETISKTKRKPTE